MKIRIVLSVILIMTGLAASAFSKPSGKDGEASLPAGDIPSFLTNLQEDGFIVQEAEFGVIDILGLYDAGYLDSCYGNNPSTPYMLYWMPPAPGEKYDATETIQLGKAINNRLLIRGLQTDYRMRPDEALVFVGKTPPDVSYFSFRSYLFSRVCQGKRKEIFASLGDPVNHRTIRTEGTPGGRQGDPFDKRMMLITTADSGINDRVRAAAGKAAFPEEIMNTDVIPAPLSRMGLEDDADTFLVLLRLAFFKDETAGKEYMKNSGARVFRITPGKRDAPKPYPVQPLRIRGTGTVNELNLQGAINDLRNAILEKYSDFKAEELKTGVWLFEGFDAIQQEINVIGENRDTVYLRSEEFTLGGDPNEFLIVYGVNHTAAGKSLYNNFGIFGSKAINGIGAVSNLDFTGSAESFLPGHPQAQYLYVWKVARRANGDRNCLIAPWNKKSRGIDLDEKAFIGFRAYVEPQTNAGPYWSELYYDRVIKFRKD